MDSKKKMASHPDAVRQVSVWALSTGCAFIVIFTVVHSLVVEFDVHIPCSPSWFFLRCVELTDKGAAKVAASNSALWIGMLLCAEPQAAAAALALHLPCRYSRVRRALAYVALALAIIGHSMYARAGLLLHAADPGGLFVVITYTLTTAGLVAVDLLCFLALLLGREN